MTTPPIATDRGAVPITFVITTLAEYQTEFWAPVAAALKNAGLDVLVVAFDSRSAEMLEAQDIPTERVLGSGANGDDDRFHARLAEYGIEDINALFSHERLTFGIRDSAVLQRKFMHVSDGLEKIFDRLAARGGKAVLIQELGGFVSVIASFHAARHRGVDNWFIEPAFFRGRLFFQRNTFKAFDVPGPIAERITLEVNSYLDETLRRQAIVIPRKDTHQYTSVLGKLTNKRNIRRLVEKIRDKHLLGKHQEFGYIGLHVARHLEMMWNAVRLRGLYTELKDAGDFIYFPLHVPLDMALTLRSPEYLDQLAIIDYLLRVVPSTHRVAIKEHPAQVGAMPAARIRALKKQYDNLIVLPPVTNNYDVLNRASAVLSINSKSGAEALLVGKPVLTLGDSFYAGCELVTWVASLRDLKPALMAALRRERLDDKRCRGYFQTVYDRSWPGELYVSDPDNIATFAESLMQAVQTTSQK